MEAYTSKVNKVLFKIMVLGILVTIPFAVLGTFNSLVPTIALVVGVVLSVALKGKENNDEIVRLIYLIALFITFAAIMIDKPIIATGEGCLAICAAAIYFRKWIVVLYGGGISAVVSYIYFINHSYNTEVFIINLSCIAFVSIVLFLLQNGEVSLL